MKPEIKWKSLFIFHSLLFHQKSFSWWYMLILVKICEISSSSHSFQFILFFKLQLITCSFQLCIILCSSVWTHYSHVELVASQTCSRLPSWLQLSPICSHCTLTECKRRIRQNACILHMLQLQSWPSFIDNNIVHIKANAKIWWNSCGGVFLFPFQNL